MNIDDLTYKEIKDISCLMQSIPRETQHPYAIGEMYFIRTVTMYLCGRLVDVLQQELVLENAAWIPDTGKFSEALNDASKLHQVEPFPDGQVIVGRGAIIDAVRVSWPEQRQLR